MRSEESLQALLDLYEACDPTPWRAWVEGRDHVDGDSFIQTGVGAGRGDDIYVTRDSGTASAAYLDLIAAAVSAVPELVEEIRHHRRESGGSADPQVQR